MGKHTEHMWREPLLMAARTRPEDSTFGVDRGRPDDQMKSRLTSAGFNAAQLHQTRPETVGTSGSWPYYRGSHT